MKKVIMTALSVMMLTGCATQSYQFERERIRYEETEMQNFFFFGIGQEEEFDAMEVCKTPEDIVKIETAEKPLSVLIKLLVAPIYTPRDVTVYCKD
ncbi:MAG TPA: hypothetical protein DCL21_04585 [Alphaproteobacteria bacterium]|nr:hypothetical protein [Alphaproteobacteria bacterium]